MSTRKDQLIALRKLQEQIAKGEFEIVKQHKKRKTKAS